MREALLASLLLACSAWAAPVTLTAKDGLKVYGEYVSPPKGSQKPLVVLFHQAHANKSEYAPIQPKLKALGYGSLAIDQRSGGELFGADNQTAAQLKSPASYQAAMPDLEAALAYGVAHSPSHQVIVWGSSYSAALAFPLVAAHPKEVRALFAFSPGEYFDEAPKMIRTAAAKVTVPIFVTSAPSEDEVSQARAILAASPSKTKKQFVPKEGVHGASILREDRDPKGANAAWGAVKAFLARVTGSR
jgi:dienelactone hydrolase